MTPRWRFLLAQGLKLCVAVASVVGSIAAFRQVVHPALVSALGLGETASSALRRAGIFGAMLVAYWAFVRGYEKRPAGELAFRWSWTALAAAAGVLSIAPTILLLYATGHYELISFRGFGGAPGVVGMIAIAAVLEELAFRAVLFRILEETAGTTFALVASAVVFSVVHLTNHGVHAITPLTVTLAGLMWGLLFIGWRNLWVAAAHHCCWNATIFLIGVPLSGEDWRDLAPWLTATHGSELWTGGAFGPEDSLVSIVVMALLCAALWRLARRRGGWVGPPGFRRGAQRVPPPTERAGSAPGGPPAHALPS